MKSTLKKSRIWMVISGVCGLSLFLIANPFVLEYFGVVYSPAIVQSGLFAGLLQICVNTFVFITWTNGFIKERGFRKIIPVFGVVIPFIMAAITLCRVIVPAVFN
jgi:hypothetical protein